MLPSLACSYSIMMDGCSGTRVLISFWQLDSCCTETLHVRQCPSLPSKQTLTRTGLCFLSFLLARCWPWKCPGLERDITCAGAELWLMFTGGLRGVCGLRGVWCVVWGWCWHMDCITTYLGELCNYHSVGSSHSGSVNDWILWGKIES